MKKIFLAFLMVLLPSIAFATDYVDEGFEPGTTFDGTPAAICYGGSSEPTCVSGQTTCADGNGQYTKFQTVVKHSGSGALESMIGVWSGGDGAGAYIDPTYYPAMANKTNLYLRWYSYFDPAYRWYERNKIFRWHTVNGFPDIYVNCNGITGAVGSPYGEDSGGGLTRCDIGVYFIGGACDGVSPWSSDEFYYIARSSGANKGVNWLVTTGGWYYFEININMTTRRLNFWMQRPEDATPTQVITNKSMVGCSGMTGAGNQYFNYLDFDYWINVGNANGGIVWTDDLKISDSYIGPTDGTPIPPSAQGCTISGGTFR